MKKALWIILAVLFAAGGARNARADTYNYKFLGSGVFAGTDVIFSTEGPAQDLVRYTPTFATNLVVTINSVTAVYGPIVAVDFDPVVASGQGQILILDTALSPGSFRGPIAYCPDICEQPREAPGPGVALTLSGVGLLGLMLAMGKRHPLGHP